MNAKDIIGALKMPDSKYYKNHAIRLAGVYSFLKQIRRDIRKVEILDTNHPLKFGRATEMRVKNCEPYEYAISEGKDVPAALIRIETKTGEYKFAVPYGAIYNEFCEVLRIATRLETAPAPIETPIRTIYTSSDVLRSLGKAAKFVSKDDLRPNLQRVCITMDRTGLEVAATNCHYLYRSRKMDSWYRGERLHLLIDAKDAVALSKKKPSRLKIPIELFPDYRIKIDGVECQTLNESFPDFRAIIPTYSEYMTVDRNGLISAVKEVLPLANKATHQVALLINGNIKIETGDVDFGCGSEKEISYLEKTFPDMAIAFDGKLLTQSLASFEEETVKIYSAGESEKMVIVSNDVDSVMLMPLVMNH